MALLGWLGTLLGALGILLALSTAPSTWSAHHHAVYVLLLVLIVVCLLITVAVPLWYGWHWASIRLRVWRAARNYNPLAGMPMSSHPGLVTGKGAFTFQTDRQQPRWVITPSRPAGLRIIEPFEAHVWASSLPCPVRRHGKTIFRVTQFLPLGFTIEDQCPGILVTGEISYSDLARIPPQSPQEP